MRILSRYLVGGFVASVAVFIAITMDFIGKANTHQPIVLQYSRSTNLSSGEQERLDAFIGQTIGEERILFHVLGHTGERGDVAANLDLSKKRAAHVADLLQKAGVSDDRISFVDGVGAADPLPALSDETESARQRRMARVVVTVVVKK